MLDRFVYVIIKSINPFRFSLLSPFFSLLDGKHWRIMGFVPRRVSAIETESVLPINGSCDVGYEVYVNTFGMQLRPKVSTRPINHSKSGIVWHQHAQGRAPFRLTAILQVNIRCNSNQGITVDVYRLLSAVPEYSRRFIRGTTTELIHSGNTIEEPSQVFDL